MRARQFFLQMSGVPGSGKTTVATAVAVATNGIIIDHNITKSALLDVNIPADMAGVASYQVLHALANHLLQQGQSVIFDSPCLYSELLQKGQQLAERWNAVYLYIECVLNDLDALDRRLQSRRSHGSQLTSIRQPPSAGSGKSVINDDIFLDWMQNMKRPTDDYLVLDTSQNIETCIQGAVDYVFSQILSKQHL